MSDATQKAVTDAIEAHLADVEDGAILRGYVLSAIGQTVDDALLDPDEGSRTRGFWLVSPGQMKHLSIGIAHHLVRLVEGDVA